MLPLFTRYSRSIQRMYDYPLGGKDNYTADRAAVEGLLTVWPDAFVTVRENRAFLSRAVRYLAISHGASDLLDQETWKGIGDSWNGRVQQQFIWRSRDQVARFFAGTDLVEPGLVPVEEWRPEPDSTDKAKPAGWGVVGRKR